MDAQFQRIKRAVTSPWRYLLSCWRWREEVAELIARVEAAPLTNEQAQKRIHSLELALVTVKTEAQRIPELEARFNDAHSDKLAALKAKQESEIALEATQKLMVEAQMQSDVDKVARQAADDRAHKLEVELAHWKEEHRKKHEEMEAKHRHVANLTRFIFTSRRLDHAAGNGTILEALREANGR